MKYKIEVNGRGGESFLFKLTEEKYEYLKDMGIEDDNMSYDDIIEFLEVDDVMDTNDIVSGIYTSNDCLWIKVTDESDVIVWESDDDFYFEECEDFYQYNDDNYLLVEDYQKGNFFNYILEIEDDFDPSLLSSKVVELLDGRSELITDIKYDGSEMEKDYGDTVSKGFTYILS